MTREIKFRAFVKSVGQMTRVWTMGFADFGAGPVDQILTSLITPNQVQRPPEDVVLMQCTGLKDRDGKEVYEDDIIRLGAGGDDDTSHHRIKWSNEMGCYHDTRLEDGDSLYAYERDMDWVKEGKVVGNHHEAPYNAYSV